MKNKKQHLSKLSLSKKTISQLGNQIQGGIEKYTDRCLTLDDICKELSFNPNCRSLIGCPQN